METTGTRRSGKQEIGVVHLIRRRNGLAPFERFLMSYRQSPAGVHHELILIFKGFPFGRGTGQYDRMLADVPHRRMFLGDYGFDLRPYFKAVDQFDYPFFCFLNSFSRILDSDWLAKLYRWITVDNVGLVGVAGSYESFSGNRAELANSLAKAGFAENLRWRLRHLVSDPSPQVIARRALIWVAESSGVKSPSDIFPPFPNYHIRTNAFMSSRQVLSQIQVGLPVFKWSVYALESGINSITNQVLRLGLRALVVARTGEAFDKEQWHASDTFRQSRQQNLLVADNQTDAYLAANAADRAILSRRTWGRFSRPA